jgi:hypothetical protein
VSADFVNILSPRIADQVSRQHCRPIVALNAPPGHKKSPADSTSPRSYQNTDEQGRDARLGVCGHAPPEDSMSASPLKADITGRERDFR